MVLELHDLLHSKIGILFFLLSLNHCLFNKARSRKTERYIKRKIRSLVLSRDEYKEFEPKLKTGPHILIWEDNKKYALN